MVETYADVLPADALISMRESGGGVDTSNFRLWALHFISAVSHLTENDRKVMLVLDGYRSHMAVGTLELLDVHNIIVYALPAHTSGKMHSLDVTVFSAFKAAPNDAINIAILRSGDKNWDSFTFCRMLTFAYEKSFTLHNIQTGFRRAGLFSLDSSQLLSIPRPISHAEPDVIMEVDELE